MDTSLLTKALVYIIPIIISAIISTVIGFLVKRSLTKYYDRKEEEDQKRKEEHEELLKMKKKEEREQLNKDITDIVSKAIEPVLNKLEVIGKGTQAGLRHSLYEIYDAWESKEYCPREIKADFENLYQSYHSLGKNGVMDNNYAKLMSMPDSKPKSSKKVLNETKK